MSIYLVILLIFVGILLAASLLLWLLRKVVIVRKTEEELDANWLVIVDMANSLVATEVQRTAEDPYMKRNRLLAEHNAELQAKAARKKVTDAAWYQRNKQRHKDMVKARYLQKKALLSGLGDSPVEQQPST